jgi:porphobilinogen deaminase
LLSRRPDLRRLDPRQCADAPRKVGREVEATLLASAGLNRLGMRNRRRRCPSCCRAAQGAVGVEVLGVQRGRQRMGGRRSRTSARAPRRGRAAFLLALGGDCRSAIAAQGLARY